MYVHGTFFSSVTRTGKVLQLKIGEERFRPSIERDGGKFLEGISCAGS